MDGDVNNAEIGVFISIYTQVLIQIALDVVRLFNIQVAEKVDNALLWHI